MDQVEDIFNIKLKNFNLLTLISVLFLISGIIFYIGWIVTYGVFYDIGIYSITIVFVLAGILGILLTLRE
ncbi:MAG: hypothetical protein V5A68_04360 [Candidatus Thermoplasmatota archaeon]